MRNRINLHLTTLAMSVLLIFFAWMHPAHGASPGASPGTFKTPEFYNSGGLDIINAAEAYSLGYTGQGVTLGIMDEAIRTDHPELAGKAVAVPSLSPSGDIYVPDWTVELHGTLVGGMMTAYRDGVGMHGVAFDANLLGVTSSFLYQGTLHSNANAYEQFAAHPEVRIINNSWGRDIYAFGPAQGDVDSRKNLLHTAMSYDSLSQMARLALNHQDKVIVFAADNYGYAAPPLSALLPRYLGAEVRNWISVTSLNPANISRDQNGRLVLQLGAVSSFTDLSAGAELWSVMAPGSGINSIHPVDGYLRANGTSLATPHVSGALGLVQQVFPWMSGKQLADSVLTTADNNFELPKAVVRIQLYTWNFSITNFGTEFGSWEPSKEELKDLVREAYAQDPGYLQKILYSETLQTVSLEDYLSLIDDERYVTATLTREQVFGQGILDVGKAVHGIARLDANRMVKEDVYDLRGMLGGTDKVALETFDTKGYAAEFSNDITERRWDDKYHHPDFQTTATGDTADNAHALTLKDLSVGLRKTGEGLLILSGTNTYTGPTVVDGGALAVSRRWDGSGGVLQNSDVLVGEAGSLLGDGEISGAMVNNGIVAPGATGRVLSVGSYTQNPGALLNITFDATGGHTALSTTTATLNGGTLQLCPAVGFYSDTLLRMDTLVSGVVTGAFDNVNLLSLSPTLSFRLPSGSHAGAVVEQRRTANAYSQYASSGNATRAGRVLRGIAEVAESDMQNLLTTLDFSAPDGSTVRTALTQLTAAPYARAAQASAEANLGIGRIALAQLRTAAMTENEPAANGTSETCPLASGDGGDSAQWSAFVMPFGGGSWQQQYSDAPAYSSSQAGLMGGVFRKADHTSMSLYSTFSRRQVNMRTKAGARARSNALHVGAAALWSEDSRGAGSGWQLWGQGQAGVENTDMRRSVAFAEYARQNNSSYTSFNGVAQLGGGYLWQAGELSFGPRVGLEYALNALPSIREDDGGASRLSMDAHTRHDLRGTAGLMAAWNKNMDEGRSLRVNAEAVWRQDLLPEPHEIRTHFTGYGQHAFDTRVEREGRSSLGLMGGVEVSLRQDITLNAQVEADVLRPDYNSLGGSLSLRWEF